VNLHSVYLASAKFDFENYLLFVYFYNDVLTSSVVLALMGVLFLNLLLAPSFRLFNMGLGPGHTSIGWRATKQVVPVH
jgi:hypothetical protein